MEEDDLINKEVAAINRNMNNKAQFKLPIKNFAMAGNQITKDGHIMIQDNNIFAGLDSAHMEGLEEMKMTVGLGGDDILIKQEEG